MIADGHKIVISNPEKILFPESGITKQELVDYYAGVWPYIYRHLADRPVSLQRYPDGIHAESFFHKETPAYFPDYIDKALVKDEEGGIYNSIINNKASLIYIANLASIPIHTWQSRQPKLENPDQIIFDLDPSDDDFQKVAMGARLLKYMLEDLGLKPFVKTSGSKGVHLSIPIVPEYSYEKVKEFTRQVAEFVSKRLGELFTNELSKKKRQGRVFVDYLRNQYGHTAVVAYSVRALPEAPVAVPIEWEELEDTDFHPRFVNIRNFEKRIKSKGDLWKDFYKHPQSLTEPIEKMKQLYARISKEGGRVYHV